MDKPAHSEWPQVQLRELHVGGVTSVDPQGCPEESFEYYSIPAYQEGGRPQAAIGKEIQSQKLLIPANCVLFGKLNPRVEKVWNVRSTVSRRRLASTEWLPIVPVDSVDQDFAYYLLRSDWVMPIAKGLVSGSTPSRERVEPKAFYDLTVPLPPLVEQKAIARVLSLLERYALSQDAMLLILRELKRAAMHDLFTRGLRGEPQKDTEVGLVPASWDIRRLEDDHDIAGGGTPLRSVDAYWVGGTIPWVKTGEVNYSVIRSTEEHITQSGVDNSSARLLPPGTILIAMFGQGVTRGRVAILGIEATCNQACAAVRPRNDRVDTRFLYHVLTSKYEELRQLAHGGQQQNLNIDIVRNFQVAVPSTREEQQEIVAVLDAIDSKIDLHRRKKAVLDKLFKSLLHKLMTGEVRVADLDLSALPAPEEARP